MARPPRIDFPNAVYHVTSRGNGRGLIFWSDDDRQRFLAQLADSLHTAGVQLYAFALMENHFHMLVKTPRANLSRFMQRLLTRYALYCRYKHRRPGHLFQGRFKAKLVEDDVYLAAVTRYIHLNPVKIAAFRRVGARQRLLYLQSFPWSSYAGYADANKAHEFVCYDVLKEYGVEMAAARRHYRAYVEACVLEDDGPLLEAMAASRYAIGGTAFVERTERSIEQRRDGRVQNEDLDLPRWTVALEEIDRWVARHYRIEEAALKEHGHRAGTAKAVAVELACRLADMSGRAIGEYYGLGSAAVSAIHRKVQKDWCNVLPIVNALALRLQDKRARRNR